MATMPGTQTRVDWQPQPAVSWQSDVALAYAIFRLTFGVNICFRGVARIFVLGLDNFASGMIKQFAMTWIARPLINPFAHTLPLIETVLGIMIILGLGTRYAPGDRRADDDQPDVRHHVPGRLSSWPGCS